MLALLAFCAVCPVLTALLERWAPGARVADEVPRAKFRHFARAADDYELVFIGSSRVYREFVPSLFDAELLRHGRNTRSFNFGMQGMRHPEMRYIAQWILRRRPAALRWLVIELTGEMTESLGRHLHEENPLSDRVIAWHTPALSWLVTSAFLAGDFPAADKWRALGTHALHLAYRFTNTGTGIPAGTRLLGYDPPQAFDYGQTGGHVSLDAEGRTRADLLRRHEAFLADPGDFEAELDALLRREAPPAPDPHLVASLLALVAEIQAAGVEPVFVIMPPHWREGVGAFTDTQTHGLPTLFPYNDPERFPDFYDRRNLYNLRHLNEHGARLFTRRFARDFAQRCLDTDGATGK